MAITQSFTTTIQSASGATVATERATASANSEAEFAVEIAASATEILTIAVDVSELQGFWIKTDKAVTLKTNDDGSPDQTIALVADQVFHWHRITGGAANPLTTDITSLSIVNGVGAVANVSGAFLQNV